MSEADTPPETKDRILAVARRLFAESGYAATSIEKVLQESDVSRGSLYYYFKSKQALFEAVLEQVEMELIRIQDQAFRTAPDPRQGVRAACYAFLQCAQKPDVRQIVLIDAHSVLGWDKLRALEERYGLGRLKQAVSFLRGPAAAAVEIDMFAHVLLVTMMELAFLVARAADSVQAIESARKTVDRLLASMQTA